MSETLLGPDARALKREKIVDVLWSLQKERGWIDDQAVQMAATQCDMSPHEVDEIATFYNLLFREPAGRTQIFVCDSISCELTGANDLMARLSELLSVAPGGVTADGEFGLLPIVCLGHCERAPCLLAGEAIHGPCAIDRESVQALLQRIRNERGSAPSTK